MNKKSVRVRFAPSPTGPLHIGGLRTALYNFLFARQHRGTFILRIEDTDQSRLIPGAEHHITESLEWCGIFPDEGGSAGGPFFPYHQSERTTIYSDYVRLLIEKGHAYYAFDSPDELESLRGESKVKGRQTFQYDSSSRMHLKNSLSLNPIDVRHRLDRWDPYVVRIRIPENETVVFSDLIRGQVTVDTHHLDDKVLFKSDGLPTYHLANVVDDYLMQITHVIRGEEWLPSAPMHFLLYRFFGWESAMPEFAHLPLILKPDGAGKLSKRDGDRLGFPVFTVAWNDPVTGVVSPGYREDGYLPDALINMLALLGWNPGTEQEFFSLAELITQFSLERIHKSGSKFDPEKTRWFNHKYLAQLPESRLSDYLVQQASFQCSLPDSGIKPHKNPPCHSPEDRGYAMKIVGLVKDRAILIPDLWVQSSYFYYAPESYDPKVKEKYWLPDTPAIVRRFLSDVSTLDCWNQKTLDAAIHQHIANTGIRAGQLLMPLRLLVTGSNQGIGMTEIAEILGKSEFLRRIEVGLLQLG